MSRRLSYRGRKGIIRACIGAVEKVDTAKGESVEGAWCAEKEEEEEQAASRGVLT